MADEYTFEFPARFQRTLAKGKPKHQRTVYADTNWYLDSDVDRLLDLSCGHRRSNYGQELEDLFPIRKRCGPA